MVAALAVVATAVVWKVFFALPAHPEGLAPIPSTFADVEHPLDSRLTLQGEAMELENPDLDTGPGVVALYRFAQISDEVEARLQRVYGPDKRAPGAKVEVAVGSARAYAEIGLGEEIDSPLDEVSCSKLPADRGAPGVYACHLDYGNGWVISTYGDVGLTGQGRYEDLKALVSVATSVKDHNAFERAVANHITL